VSTPVGSYLPPSERPFGKYELVAKIAMGGMAEIFLARQTTGDRKLVVIKRVLPHLVDEERFIAMFRDEARLASRIIHPNVCQTFEAGTVGHTYFISMEYLFGVPLSRLLLRAARTKEPINLRLATGIIAQCCEGLEHAHNLKSADGKPLDVVHRDISPPNIFVTAEGYAKILDFGVAKAKGASQKTRTGTVKGKNSYMSPEQILGKEVDRRSDVFSLGVVLWETLTAKRLFSRDTDFLTFKAITEADIPSVQSLREDVSDELAAVVAKALARERDDRYSTAEELRQALIAAMESEGGIATRDEVKADLERRFSKELDSKKKLITNVTDQLQAIGGPDLELDLTVEEVDEDELDQAARAEDSPIPPGSRTPILGVPTFTSTKTELVDGRGRKRRIAYAVLAGLAVAVVAFFGLRFLEGGDEASANGSPAKAGDQTSEKQARTAVADAGVVGVVATPTDAAPPPPPDASLPDAAPKVDRRKGYLTVDSHPYATIYVDGKKAGVTPIFKKRLPPGKHRIKAVSATGATKRMSVTIKPGRTKNLGRLTW
jgi:serine/threonine-protein kinase